jgi:hypothetical protein
VVELGQPSSGRVTVRKSVDAVWFLATVSWIEAVTYSQQSTQP